MKIINKYMTFLNNLNWRYAVKKFDKTKKVSELDLQKIKDAIRMAPTSFGLQPFKVYILENPEIREKVKAESFGQAQVTDASHLFVFVARSDFKTRIMEYCDLIEKKSESVFDRVKEEATMLGFTTMKTDEGRKRYASEQAYVALGFGLAACTELQIDSCPMGGFHPGKVAEVLGLSDNEEVVAYMAVGYRLEDCKYPKARFDDGDIFKMI